ncbi:hypothetical protein YPF_1269 [Yersinia pestis biovar Orientalis str. India 195]|nr:hypothetical protein YPF_1269 [Yersinia pestis biovar Orientalis str. India 195]
MGVDHYCTVRYSPIQTSNLTPDEAAEAYRKMMG